MRIELLAIVLGLSLLVWGLDPPKYSRPEAAARVESLVGKSRNEYVCNQVVNYGIYGVKDYKGYLANTYLQFGTKVSNFAPGYVIVAVDGVHVGMVSADGKMFIHSSSSKWQVVKVSLDQLKYIFPQGYQIRGW